MLELGSVGASLDSDVLLFIMVSWDMACLPASLVESPPVLCGSKQAWRQLQPSLDRR